MKFFLEWSTNFACGFIATAILHAFGFWSAVLCTLLLCFIMLARWYMGRFLE